MPSVKPEPPDTLAPKVRRKYKPVEDKGRSPEEVRNKMSLILATQSQVKDMHEAGQIDKETYEEYDSILNATLNTLNWFLGHDIEFISDQRTADALLAIAERIPCGVEGE